MEKQIGRIRTGCLVISLDFEMMWGNLEHWTLDGYGKSNVSHVRDVVDRLIRLFDKYDVHATFATVGLLMLSDKKDAMRNIPNLLPSYSNSKLSPYANDMIENIPPEAESLYFAPDLIKRLKATGGIEIGSHTFSHFYCWEPGQTEEQFRSDLEMANKIAESNGIINWSIIFPRNNVSDSYLKTCADVGIRVYRGNPKRYFNETNRLGNLFYRVLRLLDAYVNTGNFTSYDGIDIGSIPVNIPASRFIRPYNRKLRLFEGLRLRRIKNEMIRAAKHNEIYHIWWHPHNFGANMEENFAFLEHILSCFDECRSKYGMKSMTMNELYNQIKK